MDEYPTHLYLSFLIIHQKMRINLFPLLFFVPLLYASCTESEKKNYTPEQIFLVAEGPLFDGPNTLQGTLPINISDIKPEEITSVKLTKAEITTADSAGFNRIRNMVLQLSANNAAMQKAGVLNPVPKDKNSVLIQPFGEADLKDVFKQSEMFVILDADLEGNMDENLNYSCKLEFEITYKK